MKKIGISLKRRFLPLERNHLFHSELAAGAGQRKAKAAWSAREENRDFSQKAFLPLERNHLFHSELAVGAGQNLIINENKEGLPLQFVQRQSFLCYFKITLL